MQRQGGLLLRTLLMALDGALFIASLRGAYFLRFESGLLAAPKGIPPLDQYIPSFLFALLLGILLFEAHGLYGERARLSRLEETLRLSRAVTLSFLAVMAATFLYRDISFSRMWLGMAWALSLVLLALGRLGVRSLEGWLYRRGIGVRRVAILGTGEMGCGVLRKLQERPGLGLVPVGFIAPGLDSAGVASGVASPLSPPPSLPAPMLGSLDNLAAVAAQHDLALLVVIEVPARREDLLDIVTRCQVAGLECRLVPDLFSLMTSGAPVVELDGIPLISLRGSPFGTLDRVIKRALDLVGATLGLLLALPFLAALAVIIRLDSPGPVFYRQRRVGLDGKTFTMVKLRSMRPDAERESGATWAHEEDPRATRFGRFLRRTSLDELPQLYNVLVGDMSLVGPRPEREPFVEIFQGTIPRYLERLRMKSGVTGWAQVNGFRGNTSIEARTMHDIYYVENWSVGFDLRILLLTAGHLIQRLGGRRTGPSGAPAGRELEPDRMVRERRLAGKGAAEILGAAPAGAAPDEIQLTEEIGEEIQHLRGSESGPGSRPDLGKETTRRAGVAATGGKG